MRTLRGRFILSHILPILLVAPLVGLALAYLLETQVMLTDMSEDITEKSTLIANAVANQPNILQDANAAEAFAADVGLLLDEQVLLLDPQGVVLAVSRQPLSIESPMLETAVSEQTETRIFYGLFEQRVIALAPVTDINAQLVGIVGVVETLSTAASIFSRLRWLIALTVLIELAVGGLIGFYLAVRLERPISTAANAVIAIANGESIEPIPEQGPIEIRSLSTAVNTLAERLRILEDTRRRLLANLVHEIGRPLGAMRSAVHVLRHGAGDDPEIREELLAGVEDEIERMQPLLNDLAQLHGQVLGTLELNRQPTPISTWLPPLLLPWRSAAQAKGLQWQTDIPPDLPVLNIDPDRLAQVVGNLCSNAIKYTPNGGAVTVTAVADPQEVRIQISDTGAGIVPAEQQKVFEPFFRSRQQRRFPQGLGLGLTIANDLVEAHGGWLELQSTPEEGSQFCIHLPRLGANTKQ